MINGYSHIIEGFHGIFNIYLTKVMSDIKTA